MFSLNFAHSFLTCELTWPFEVSDVTASWRLQGSIQSQEVRTLQLTKVHSLCVHVHVVALCAYVYVSGCTDMCGRVYLVWKKKRKKTSHPRIADESRVACGPACTQMEQSKDTSVGAAVSWHTDWPSRKLIVIQMNKRRSGEQHLKGRFTQIGGKNIFSLITSCGIGFIWPSSVTSATEFCCHSASHGVRGKICLNLTYLTLYFLPLYSVSVQQTHCIWMSKKVRLFNFVVNEPKLMSIWWSSEPIVYAVMTYN